MGGNRLCKKGGAIMRERIYTIRDSFQDAGRGDISC